MIGTVWLPDALFTRSAPAPTGRDSYGLERTIPPNRASNS